MVERYKLNDDSDVHKNWKRLLDFESPIKVESDWYSTNTFQLFLDALDINQPQEHSTPSRDGQDSGQHQQANNKRSPKSGEAIPSPSSGKQPREDNVETILSAEALKILSELPDLSHISATRSFILPRGSS